jgi:hypothetical protein
MSSQSKIFFAGGTKGPNARADGNGGFLARGWYIYNTRAGRFGPLTTLAEARRHHMNVSDVVEPKMTRWAETWAGAK